MFDLNRIDKVTVGVLGDIALDIYWYADMRKSELSRETPHYPLPMVREVISLGAGGNVVNNIAALEPKALFVCGVCGDDWRGNVLRQKLAEVGADTTGLVEEKGRFTQAYCKPMRMGISDVVYEDPRLDFATYDAPTKETEETVIAWLDKMDGMLDMLCVCDQFRGGIVTPAVMERLGRMKTPIMVDSRYQIGAYKVKGILKPNEDECKAALEKAGLPVPEGAVEMANTLRKLTGAEVLLTLGERGSVFVGNGEEIYTPAVRCNGPLDICGAGDTSLSAFASAWAAGADPAEAAEIASFASAVTVQKIGMTGTATRAEILAIRQ